ncbi:HTH-type transcriptional repressor [Streptomyces sp. RB17]|uniref:TetR/AcrR family transcriptional regulator n=1 Tax=Streptomyces sp. RB17 TaxID=2585197 RepID=UPI001297763C|nr:TetR family transcriptional regulator [Streptomyces sp. RB17]MQY36697.1 HTH-type transcriptional repressor [Streptomyces sp. RB17]
MTTADSRSAAASPRRTPRRARTPEDRQVDAERTRTALLDAALEEFAARGFMGARVRDIAARAGVSKDLVNYHFDSKEGLYLAVQRAWLQREAAFADPSLPLAELAARYLDDALRDPRPMRLLAWRGLSEPQDSAAARPPAESEDLSGVRRRQEDGEVAPGLDPASLRLVLLGAVAAPVVFPDMARRLFGTGIEDPDFRTRYEQGLRDLVRQLAPGGAGEEDGETEGGTP